MTEALYLVSRGVPFDIAFSVADAERAEWCAILRGLEGFRHDAGEGRRHRR